MVTRPDRGVGVVNSPDKAMVVGWAILSALLWLAGLGALEGLISSVLYDKASLLVQTGVLMVAALVVSFYATRRLRALAVAPRWLWAAIAVGFGLQTLLTLWDLVRPDPGVMVMWLGPGSFVTDRVPQLAAVLGAWLATRRPPT